MKLRIVVDREKLATMVPQAIARLETVLEENRVAALLQEIAKILEECFTAQSEDER